MCHVDFHFCRFTVFSTTMDDLMVTIPFYPVVFLRNLEQSSFIPCDLKRARRFFSVYGLDKSENAEIFRLKAKNLLTSVKAQLDQLGIPFWLSSGTCLGKQIHPFCKSLKCVFSYLHSILTEVFLIDVM